MVNIVILILGRFIGKSKFEQALRIEISENENRKDFSFNEKITWSKMLSEEYQKVANENMSKGGQGCQISDTLRVDDKVAQEVGFGSRDTLRKAEYIAKNADEDLIKSLDEGKLSINKAYITLKQQKELLEGSLMFVVRLIQYHPYSLLSFLFYSSKM